MLQIVVVDHINPNGSAPARRFFDGLTGLLGDRFIAQPALLVAFSDPDLANQVTKILSQAGELYYLLPEEKQEEPAVLERAAQQIAEYFAENDARAPIDITQPWLAPHVARVARLLMDKFQKQVTVYFIDPDQVEEKNCYRQNFCPAEIGHNKAEALAFRLGLSWGLQIVAVAQAFERNQLRDTQGDGLKVLIGCVDNAAARQAIQETCEYFGKAWWLDCGNHQANGQVLLGCGSNKFKDPYELPGLCAWLPLPSARHPELLEPLPEETVASIDTTRMSCADLAMLDSQGLAINPRIAAEAADYLVRMLLTRDLCKWGTYIDLASGTTRSRYIVEEGDHG